jgi:hypothetical protein
LERWGKQKISAAAGRKEKNEMSADQKAGEPGSAGKAACRRFPAVSWAASTNALPWRRHDAQSWVAIWRMPILAGGQSINGWLIDRRRTQAG